MHRANAANDHDQQDLVGHAGFEGGGLHAGLIHGKHCAGDTGKEAADDKAHALVAGKVDAHGFGSDLVITDGFEGTAIGGVDEQQNDGDADAGEEEGHHGFQMQGRAAQRKVEAGKAGKAVQKVGAVGQRAKALVNHGGTDDLGKAQCSNGKIVALELQHRQADEEGEQRCDKTGQDQAEHNTQQQAEAAQRFGEQLRDGETDAAVCIALIDGLLRSGGNGEDGVGVLPEIF